MRPLFSQSKSKKEIYTEQYEASKQGGEAFFPETLARDAIVALLVVTAIIALAIILPARSEPPADPSSITYNPRPEWYFLFFFQFLKLFPGWLESVAAVVVPVLALLMLGLVPFLDHSPERRWSQRRPILGIGILMVSVLAVLEIAGAISAPSRPVGEESLTVQEGRKVYQAINCAYCHSINGAGGHIGPDLSTVGATLDKQTLTTYLQNPHAMVPATLHPKLEFTQEELDTLAAYLLTLGAPVTYSAQAPALFEKECSACHMINGKGGTVGPDLSGVGKYRSVTFLQAFIIDPKSVLPGATMPAYRKLLTQDQIKDLAAYLFSLKGGTPAPSPSP